MGNWMRLTRAATVMAIISVMGLVLSGCTSSSMPPDPVRSYSVQGVVTRAYGGQGLSDVTLLCGAFGTTTTATDGTWAMDGLKGRVIISPAKDGWSFSPASAEVSGPCTADFIATPVGTPVGGEITTDVIWTLECSPYILTSSVQVGPGGTLTIEPGVTVEANGHDIEIKGELRAVGTEDDWITLNHAFIRPGLKSPYLYPEPILIDVEFANINYGAFFPGDSFRRSTCLILRDCRLADVGYSFMFTCYNGNSFCIERNVFRRCVGIYFEQKYTGTVCIRNNVFYEQSGGYAVRNVGDDTPSGAVLDYNSFLSTDRVAVSLSWYGTGAKLNAAHNYWNTTDVDTIAKMIYDKCDDSEYSGYVNFEPFLEVPHPDTPAYPF